MKRHYYITNDIENIEVLFKDLSHKQIKEKGIHIYSKKEREIENHTLPKIFDFFKTDIIHSGEKGLILGIFLSLIFFIIINLLNLTQKIGTFNVYFISFFIILLSSWEGGLIGISKKNYKISQFNKKLNDTDYLIMIDRDNIAEEIFKIINEHQNIQKVGIGSNISNPFENEENLNLN
jgi:hypothetical protein